MLYVDTAVKLSGLLVYIKSCSHEVAKHKSGVTCFLCNLWPRLIQAYDWLGKGKDWAELLSDPKPGVSAWGCIKSSAGARKTA
jgi:hypothetical protein